MMMWVIRTGLLGFQLLFTWNENIFLRFVRKYCASTVHARITGVLHENFKISFNTIRNHRNFIATIVDDFNEIARSDLKIIRNNIDLSDLYNSIYYCVHSSIRTFVCVRTVNVDISCVCILMKYKNDLHKFYLKVIKIP